MDDNEERYGNQQTMVVENHMLMLFSLRKGGAGMHHP